MSEHASTDLAVKPTKENWPHIGAFVLETLTLGMYGEPRHTLREYVQNSFDAIRHGQRIGVVTGRGCVTVTMKPDSLVIRDDGVGVPEAQAWRTLTAVGASKKERARDAGFRGIGRLAGMAYCDKLIFRTTFPGERSISTVSFDCTQLRAAMSPDAGGDLELGRLLANAVKHDVESDAVEPEVHFFEVELRGLASAPDHLIDPDLVRDYLGEAVPVDYSPEWSRAAEIRNEYEAYFGQALEVIEVLLEVDGVKAPIFKHYTDTYSVSRGEASIEEVAYFSDARSRFWGWVGKLDESAAVAESHTRGLRVRVRNIPVDGAELFEGLFAEHRPSYARFNAFYVGEFFIEPEAAILNARRDGFEENKGWSSIKKELIATVCAPLASRAYEFSNRRQLDVDKIISQIDGLVSRSASLAQSSKATYDEVVELMNTARRLRRRAAKALKIVGDLDEAADSGDVARPPKNAVRLEAATGDLSHIESQMRGLIGQFLDDDDRIAALRARLREEIVKELLAVVNVFVDSTTYQRIRQQILGFPAGGGR